MILPLETMCLIARVFRQPSLMESFAADTQKLSLTEPFTQEDNPAEQEFPHAA